MNLIRISLILFSILLLSQNALSENNVNTHTPSDSRFEIVQSSLTAKFTLKIDKFTGETFQIVRDPTTDKLFWSKIPKLTQGNDKQLSQKVNYQFFSSGLAAKFTFLININTGVTWQLTQSSKGLFWNPLSD